MMMYPSMYYSMPTAYGNGMMAEQMQEYLQQQQQQGNNINSNVNANINSIKNYGTFIRKAVDSD